MEFCPECNFMLFTRLVESEQSGKVEKKNYCKNCGWKGNCENTEVSVYKRNYDNNFIANKILRNKYTIFDNALPRLSMKCVNDKCVSNCTLDIEKTLFIDNLPENYTLEQIKDIFKEDDKSIIEYKQIRVTSLILILNDSEHKDFFKKKYQDKLVDTNKLSIDDYSNIESEILYIKYDPNNMKYLYMCVNCGSSWEGTNKLLSI